MLHQCDHFFGDRIRPEVPGLRDIARAGLAAISACIRRIQWKSDPTATVFSGSPVAKVFPGSKLRFGTHCLGRVDFVRCAGMSVLICVLPMFGYAQDSFTPLSSEWNVGGRSSAFEGGSLSLALADPDGSLVDPEAPVRRYKKQAIQKLAVSTGSLFAIDNDLSSRFVETSIGLGIPLGSFDNILGVTPSFRVDWIDAQPGLDVPTELFETGLQFFWRKTINDRWNAMAIVSPAIRSDFTTSDDALRIFGFGLLTRECIPDCLSLSFGAVFLDRADIPLLPAVGLSWTPRPTTRLDLRFPESRLSYRFAKDVAKSETWGYLSGGLGGNTWAVTRASGLTDELSLRDLRLTVGLEKIVDGGGGSFVEAGYAFNRQLQYEKTAEEISLSDGALLQAGWAY